MTAIFKNTIDNKEMKFTDKGIEFHNYNINQHILFRYGSMRVLKKGFLYTNITISDGIITCVYETTAEDIGKLKKAFPIVENLNSKAPRTKAVKLATTEKKPEEKPIIKSFKQLSEDFKLQKNINSFKNFFDLESRKKSDMWIIYAQDLIDSMDEDEEIRHGFKGFILYINGEQNSTVEYIGIITNKRFRYLGLEGKAMLSIFKSGSVELKNAHAITIGAGHIGSPPYVQFEVGHDDYRLTTFDDRKLIKAALEKVISEIEAASAPTPIVQAAYSPADEIKKYKELLDMGAITQEEYDAKKKQLLGL